MPLVVGLLFVPQLVFAYLVTLDPFPQSSVEEGTYVVFTGTVVFPCPYYESVCIPEPAPDVVVHIVDQVTDTDLVTTMTDIHGEFSAQWVAEYRNSNYVIFALASYDGFPYYSNQNYSLSVYQQPIENNIKLILNPPTPSSQVTAGQTMTFNGYLSADDKFDKRIKLLVDNVAVLVERTDQNGQFSITWKPESEHVGAHQIYVLYDEYYEIKSESYDINVISPSPFTVKIVTDTTSGAVPFWVNFNAQVDGGKEPYSFLWKIKGETITTQSFNRQFVNVDEYLVTLTVTDSLSQTRTIQTIIYAKAPTLSPLNPQIITSSEKTFEGSQVSFSAQVKDPSRVKSYEWRIDGRLIGTSDKANFVFRNDGSYLVSLNVIDRGGKQHSTSKSMSVLNVSPKITSNLQDYETEAGKALPLDIFYTDPGIEDNFTIELFVDNQKIDTKFQSSPVTTTVFFDYPNPGFYNAKVVVTDNDGGKDERNFSIVIKEPRFPIEAVIGIIAAAGGGGGYGIKKYLDTRNEPPPDLRIEIRVIRSGIER